MGKAPGILERRRLRDVAREYQRKGYQVLVEPRGSDLPVFLQNLGPDLIAHNGEEWVVVEVKSKTSLVRDPHLSQLTEVVSSRPG